MEAYLPFIAAIVVAIITAYANYRAGNLKNKIDDSGALRDDLLGLVDRYEAREKLLLDKIEKYDTQNQVLQQTITSLRLEINGLRIENQNLSAELHNVRAELAKFERKVFYTPPDNKK